MAEAGETAAGSRAGLLAHREAAYLLALRWTRNRADAEDIVQDAYLKAVRFRGRIPLPPEDRPWFLRVVVNAAHDHALAGRRRRERERTAAMISTDQPQPEPVPGQDELRDRLAHAIDALDEKLRIPLCLHYEQGIPYAEVARILAVPDATVRTWASRGIQRLRELLAEGGTTVAPAVIVDRLGAGFGVNASEDLATRVEAIVRRPAPVPTLGPAALGWTAAAALATAVVAVAWSLGGGGHPRPTPGADHGADATPAKAADPFAAPLAIDYRREYLSEVAADLERRAGVRIAFPEGAVPAPVHTFSGPAMSARQVLDRVARDDGLQLEYRDGTAFLWRTTDPALLAAIDARLAAADPWTRSEAAWDLARHGDRRIQARVVKLLKDREPGVVDWMLSALARWQLRMVGGMDPATRAAIAAAVRERAQALPAPSAKREPDHRAGIAAKRGFARVLAATSRPSDVDLLLGWLAGGDPGLRIAAAEALAAAGERRAIAPLTRALAAFPLDQPPAADSWKASSEQQGVLGAILAALLALDPSAATLSAYRSYLDAAPLLASGMTACGQTFETMVIGAAPGAQRELLAGLVAQLADFDRGPEPSGDGKLRRIWPSGAVRTIVALPIPAARDEQARIVASPRLFRYLVGGTVDGQHVEPVVVPAGDPRVREVMLAKVAEPDPAVRAYAARSLGGSRDPAAAEALIALLQDPLGEVVVAAAEALAEQRDPRATRLLAELIAKRTDLPCTEAQDDQTLQRGEAVYGGHPNPRKRLVLALGRTRDPAAVDALLAALPAARAEPESASPSYFPFHDTEAAVVCALSLLPDPRAGEAIAATMRAGDGIAVAAGLSGRIGALDLQPAWQQAGPGLPAIWEDPVWPELMTALLLREDVWKARMGYNALWALPCAGSPRAARVGATVYIEAGGALGGKLREKTAIMLASWAQPLLLDVLAGRAAAAPPRAPSAHDF